MSATPLSHVSPERGGILLKKQGLRMAFPSLLRRLIMPLVISLAGLAVQAAPLSSVQDGVSPDDQDSTQTAISAELIRSDTPSLAESAFILQLTDQLRLKWSLLLREVSQGLADQEPKRVRIHVVTGELKDSTGTLGLAIAIAIEAVDPNLGLLHLSSQFCGVDALATCAKDAANVIDRKLSNSEDPRILAIRIHQATCFASPEQNRDRTDCR